MSEKKRMGRPPVAEKHEKDVMVRYTQREMDDIASRSTDAGMTKAAFVRAVSLGFRPRIIPAINRTQWAELSRLASNLNQVVHMVNAGISTTVDEEAVSDAIEDLRAIRLELVGEKTE